MAAFYRINGGHASADNGAVAPLSFLFSLAKVLDTDVISGNHYGDDYIPVPRDPDLQKIAEDLLNENRMIWERVDHLPPHLRGYHIDVESS